MRCIIASVELILTFDARDLFRFYPYLKIKSILGFTIINNSATNCSFNNTNNLLLEGTKESLDKDEFTVVMKQIKIIFETENEILPSNYNSLALSFIKHSVELSDRTLFNEWFDKTRNSNLLGKSYTFSCSFPSPRFQGDIIRIGSNSFSFFLSTYDLVDLMKLYNAFIGCYQRHERFPMNSNSMTISWIGTTEISPIVGDRAMIKFDSSLLARWHDRETNRDKFLGFEDAGFIESVRASAEIAARNAGIKTDVNLLELRPIKAKKTVVHYFNNMRVTGNIGVYEISGPPELLNFLLLSGVGSATGSGHGKFRIMNQ